MDMHFNFRENSIYYWKIINTQKCSFCKAQEKFNICKGKPNYFFVAPIGLTLVFGKLKQ